MTDLTGRVQQLEQQLAESERERQSLQALLDARNKDYQDSNAAMRQLNLNLERLVEERTREASQARDDALAASKTKSEFLAVMSHEIRTPMNAILGFTDLLAKTPLTAHQDKYVRRIFVSSKSLLQIINDILDFSKIEAGKLHLEIIDFSIRDVFDQLREVFSNESKTRSLALSFDVEALVPHRLEGDPLRFSQIVTNLVSNALKFTEQGHIKVQARLLDMTDNISTVQIVCEDTGIGIPDSKIKRLFSPFTQADSSTTRRYGGTGLGLSICQSLCQMMGGDISVRSRAGVGSSFSFTVSLNTLEGEIATSLGRVEVQEETLDFSGKKVLLVEDNEINQELVVELLKDTRMTIEIANNGLEALEKVKLHVYDLVFMDIQMPFLDGFEVTRRIRKDIGKKELPIVAMTANASNEDRENCIQAGMDDFISKPIAPAPLFKVLATWLNTGADNASVECTDTVECTGAVECTGVGSTDNGATKIPAPILKVREELPFDRTKALQMMGGKEALLEKMLFMFKDRFSNSVAELQGLLEVADYETAQRLAHTLKGVSANIAADIVKVCAERVENRLKNYSRVELSPPDLREDINVLAEAMSDLLTYLNRSDPASQAS